MRGYKHGAFSGTEILILQVEYHLAIVDNITGVIFTDIGNVYEGSGSIDLGDFRYSYGVGLRMNTPLGPISLDYGINDQGTGETQFNIGYAF